MLERLESPPNVIAVKDVGDDFDGVSPSGTCEDVRTDVKLFDASQVDDAIAWAAVAEPAAR